MPKYKGGYGYASSSGYQRNSYDWFMKEGLQEIFHDISPIQGFTGNLVLSFEGFSLGKPKYDIDKCKERDATYSAPLRVNVRLVNNDTGEVKEQEVSWVISHS